MTAQTFDAAAIHFARSAGTGIRIEGLSVTMRGVTLGTLLRAAYGLDARHVKAPDWIEGDPFFDIVAAMPSGSTPRQVPQMIQSLLAERFQFQFHFATEERNVLALVVDKGGLQAPPSEIDESRPGGGYFGISSILGQSQSAPVWTNPSRSSRRIEIAKDGGARLTLKGVTFPELAGHLNTLDGVDIVDATGLVGHFDFEISASREEVCELCPRPPTAVSSTPTTRESLKKLGLLLEKRKASIRVFVVDRLEKTPTEN